MKNIFLLFFLLIIFSCGKTTISFEGRIPPEKKLPWFYDKSEECNLDSLLEQSKIQNKPILLYFTGYGCVNNRKMEDNIFCYQDIHDLMHKDFISWALYVDDKTKLREPKFDRENQQKELKTIGNDNSDMQVYLFKRNIQPYIVILRPDKSIVGEIAYTKSKQELKEFLIKTRNDF